MWKTRIIPEINNDPPCSYISQSCRLHTPWGLEKVFWSSITKSLSSTWRLTGSSCCRCEMFNTLSVGATVGVSPRAPIPLSGLPRWVGPPGSGMSSGMRSTARSRCCLRRNPCLLAALGSSSTPEPGSGWGKAGTGSNGSSVSQAGERRVIPGTALGANPAPSRTRDLPLQICGTTIFWYFPRPWAEPNRVNTRRRERGELRALPCPTSRLPRSPYIRTTPRFSLLTTRHLALESGPQKRFPSRKGRNILVILN